MNRQVDCDVKKISVTPRHQREQMLGLGDSQKAQIFAENG